MDSLQLAADLQQKGEQFLRVLFRETLTNQYDLRLRKISDELGWNEEVSFRIADYLEGKHLLKFISGGGMDASIELTDPGRIHVEISLRRQQEELMDIRELYLEMERKTLQLLQLLYVKSILSGMAMVRNRDIYDELKWTEKEYDQVLSYAESKRYLKFESVGFLDGVISITRSGITQVEVSIRTQQVNPKIVKPISSTNQRAVIEKPKPENQQLSYIEKKIKEAYDAFMANGDYPTDEMIAGKIPRSRTGEQYSREEVNRKRNRMRRRGIEV